jgi:uncharacterized membrane protein
MGTLVGLLGVSNKGWPGPWWNSGYGWPWPGLIWLVAVLVFWAGLIALLVWAIRTSVAPRRAPDSALEILRRRLASGEITPEEYERLRNILQG